MGVIKVNCTDKTLTITDACSIDLEGTNSIQFTFCSKWDGYIKTVFFNHIINVAIENDTVTIPSQCIVDGECFSFYVKGTKTGASDRTSDFFRLRIEAPDIIVESPEEDVHQELLSKIGNMQADTITSSEIDAIVGE